MTTSVYSLRQAVDKHSGITKDVINLNNLLTYSRFEKSGGVVLFTGQIRDINDGRQVKCLEYTYHPILAEKLLKKVIADCYDKFDIHAAIGVHRVGMLQLSDIAVAVLTMSAHRDEAYGANRYLIDQIKTQVPIWKKEYYTDESWSWPVCNHQHH